MSSARSIIKAAHDQGWLEGFRAGNAGRRAVKSEEAQEFLRSVLATGAEPAASVYERAEAQGISRRTLQDAAARLDVCRYRDGRSWWLELPTPAPDALAA